MPQRKHGRPSIAPGQESVNANVRIPTAQYDRACLRALRDCTSVSDLLRRGLKKLLDQDGDDDEDD